MSNSGNQFESSPYAVEGQYAMPGPYGTPPAKGSNTVLIIIIVVACITVPVMLLCGVGLLLPAVQAARDAARRMSDMNNMKQVTLAMHNFASANGALPAPTTIGPNGEELWSWRVELLPYLEASPLYDSIDREEPRPWSNPKNAFLLENAPASYVSTRAITAPGQTNVFIIATEPGGPESVQAAFTHGQSVSFQDVTDGPRDTIMAMMFTNASVEWTKPSAMTPEEAYATLLNERQFALAAMMDGSVKTIPVTIDKSTFIALCTRNGGELVPAF